MLYIDLENLKIVKDYHAENFNYILPSDLIDDTNMSLIETKQIVHNVLQDVQYTKGRLGAHYEIEIETMKNGAATEEEAEQFLTLVNIITLEFFHNFVNTSNGRKRERRLDVPEKLKTVKCSMGLLKNAINYETMRNKFNLIIKYKDLIYILIDEKDDVIKNAFIHDAEEAPELQKEEGKTICLEN